VKIRHETENEIESREGEERRRRREEWHEEEETRGQDEKRKVL